MFKKISNLALFFILLLQTFAMALAADDGFEDLEYDDPYIEAISTLKTQGVVEGYPDGEFKSLNKINRAEFLKIVVESITDEASGVNCFDDVLEDWYAKYVCYAKEQGIVEGYPDGFFHPANDINFAEASKVIANAYQLAPEKIEGAVWYKGFVEKIAEQKAIPESISDLDKKIYRGEMAELIWRLNEQKTDLNSLTYEDLEGIPAYFQSCEELKEAYSYQPVYYYYGVEDAAGAEESTDAGGGKGGGGSAAEDYSSTNVQVAGVDEADIVKNDGQYIYTISDSKVKVVKAYPESEMEYLGVINLTENTFYPLEMYLDGDRLVIIGNEYVVNQDQSSDSYYYGGNNQTAIYIYDVSDPSEPDLFRSLKFESNYGDSRKIGDSLYLVLNKYNYYYGQPEELALEDVLPKYQDSFEADEKYMAGCRDIGYLPRQRGSSYLILAGIPLRSSGQIDTEVLMGNSENVYASTKAMYIASSNYDPYNYYRDWNNAKTLVHRFELNNAQLEYSRMAKVPGTIINQFSMDEYGESFRIATTEGDMWSGSSTNNLFVLNKEAMNITGSITNIAPGEKIYSTRFMGDRGYMVTFQKIDPLFVFDLSDPYNPTIEGELKIPGYSDYLHPYDANHLIGFGKDAIPVSDGQNGDQGSNFAWFQGMKLSLFDITDISNPIEMFTEIIGDRGTESTLLYDHKALLFDRSKNLLAFPVSVYEYPATGDHEPNEYGDLSFVGAYVYDIDLENGFTFKGDISHGDAIVYQEDYDYYYYDYAKIIKRILYIGENLYSVSEWLVKASDMETIEEQASVSLEN